MTAIANELGTDSNVEEKLPPNFILVLQDNPDTGELEVYGQQRPQEFAAASPSHVVGWFLQNHIMEVVELAKIEFARQQRLASKAPEADGPKILLPANQMGDLV